MPNVPSIKEMLNAISESGMSQDDIATRVGVTQPTIHRAMKKGEMVSYDTGKRIEALYLEIKANDQEAA